MNSRVWMDRALALARIRYGRTAPNPCVGAVLVKHGLVIGEGFHAGPGTPHAEAVALDEARHRGHDPRGATLFVTLEPCCHDGPTKRTPPCAQRLIQEGIAAVWAAVPDPHPLVSGRGMAILAAAGVETHWGPGEVQAQALIADFTVWMVERRPFVTIKWAQSLDGHTAAPASAGTWLTGVGARRRGHELRSEHDAVAVGAGTLRSDDPLLTVRELETSNHATPRRLVFAGNQILPEQAKVFTDSEKHLTWIVVSEDSPLREQAHRLVADRVIEWSGTQAPSLGKALLDSGFYRLYVEGGARLLSRLLEWNFWDRAAIFTAPLWQGGAEQKPSDALTAPLRLADPQWSLWGEDALVEGWNPHSPAWQTKVSGSEVACSRA